ncbi:MAG: hypothetical protein HW416_3563 [Chloroflexi bacterium]|nr:hypothetical protein [Chloroflexota bacterium]
MRHGKWASLVIAALVLGCAPSSSTQSPSRPDAAQPGGPSGAPKALDIAISEDPGNFWDAVTGGGGSGVRELGHSVNSFLATTASDGAPLPRLLSELPAIDKGTWRVLPDGGMETTYKLRPGVTWHDGRAFTADDVVFSWQVNADPDVPNSNQGTVRLISGMEARDPSTVVATWTEQYPFADRMGHRDLYTVPRHLLERTYQETKDGLLTVPYWTDEYVGLGPYRVTKWDRGSVLEVRAYDKYFLGQPKIDTIRFRFMPDPNTMVANLYAHAIQSVLPPGGPDLEAMSLVKREWESTGYGSIAVEVPRWKFMEAQKLNNPQPRDLADPRSRQGLLLAINRAELATTVFGEYGVVADSWVHPSFKHYARVQEGIVRYPFDQQRASAVLAEMGWRRGADGVLEKADGQRFTLTMRTRDDQKEALIIADNWKQIGVIASYEQQTPQELRDRAARAQYTGMDISRGSMPPSTIIRSLATEQIPTVENRFAGSNRGGYSSAAWDELGRRFLSELDENRRNDLERDLARVLTTDLPLMPLMYDPDMIATGGGLTGMQPAVGTSHNGQIMHTWNIHEWDIK